MATNTIIWIVVAVVAALLVIAVVMMALKQRNQRRHVEAEHIRAEVDQKHQHLQKRAHVADETEAKARAAAAEAEAKAAEAARLRDVAAGHRSAVDSTREELDERRAHADRLDPHTKVTDQQDEEQTVTQAPVQGGHPGQQPGGHPGQQPVVPGAPHQTGDPTRATNDQYRR